MEEIDVLERVFPESQTDPYVDHMYRALNRESDIQTVLNRYNKAVINGATHREAFCSVINGDWGNQEMFSAEVYIEPVLDE